MSDLYILLPRSTRHLENCVAPFRKGAMLLHPIPSGVASERQYTLGTSLEGDVARQPKCVLWRAPPSESDTQCGLHPLLPILYPFSKHSSKPEVCPEAENQIEKCSQEYGCDYGSDGHEKAQHFLAIPHFFHWLDLHLLLYERLRHIQISADAPWIPTSL